MDRLIEIILLHPGSSGLMLGFGVLCVYVGYKISNASSGIKLNAAQVDEHEQRLKSIHQLIETISTVITKMVEKQDVVQNWIAKHEHQAEKRDAEIENLQQIAAKLGGLVDVFSDYIRRPQ